jgi:farnesyl-diphosphate farnesyltransferase
MIEQHKIQTQSESSSQSTPPNAHSSALHQSALDILKTTSRTFFIPINQLPPNLKEAVASGYLCMRAIDEIEDHPNLASPLKQKLLREISQSIQSTSDGKYWHDLETRLEPHQQELPEVTLQISSWLQLAPESITPRIWDATAAMADRMADWADRNWSVESQADLDYYTFSVAGAVGLLLSDLWAWHDGTQTNRMYAIGFGRGLQAVNILRNRSEDISRGVNFYPRGWEDAEMQDYARHNLSLAEAYLQELPAGPAYEFCKIPFRLAYGTLDALVQGKSKLSRTEVLNLINT